MSDTPTSPGTIAKHAIGLLVSTIAAGLSTRLPDIGHHIEQHPKATFGVAAAAGMMLYAWAAWTFHLWKRDSKRERVAAARAQGRPVCNCTDTGEIMRYLEAKHRADLNFYRCPACGRNQFSKENEGSFHMPPDDKLRP